MAKTADYVSLSSRRQYAAKLGRLVVGLWPIKGMGP
jgi:hypothetical protein